MKPKGFALRGFGVIGVIILSVVVLALAGVAFWSWPSQSTAPSPTPTSTTDGTATTTPPPPDQGILPYNSGITGVVMLGPTCPVMRDPPEPQCADKGYQTLVAVFRASDPVHAYALFKSDPQGRFKASLPPGEYVVGAGESNLPRCGQATVTVVPNTYTSLTISCDTGIR